MTGSFLEEPPVSPQVQALYDEDLADGGYVWNVSRLWAHRPDTCHAPLRVAVGRVPGVVDGADLV